MEILLSIAIAVIIGLLMTRVIKPLGLPAVTAYLITGVLIDPYCLGRLGLNGIGFTSFEAVEKLDLISQVALGFIAFAIGNEFRLSSLKKTGRQATIVGIVQGLVAALFVDVALIGLHFILGGDRLSIPAAITLGGLKRVAAFAEKVVPFMVVLFMLGSLIIVGINYASILPAFGAIFRTAFFRITAVHGSI